MGLSSVHHKASNTAHVWMQDLPKPPPSVTKLSLQAYTWSLHPLHEPMVCWCLSTTGQTQSPFPLSLSLSIDLSSVTFTFSLLHPLTHPPSCRPFILLTRDGSDQLSVESGGASSELGDAGICMACLVLHQCLWVGLQHPLQWKHGGQSSYHHWCFFWDWRGTDHSSLINCPFCLQFFSFGCCSIWKWFVSGTQSSCQWLLILWKSRHFLVMNSYIYIYIYIYIMFMDFQNDEIRVWLLMDTTSFRLHHWPLELDTKLNIWDDDQISGVRGEFKTLKPLKNIKYFN